MNVIIIGGGIGGLALAAALRQRGLEPRVYEQAREFRDCGAALTIWPNGMMALRRFGVASELRNAGWPITTSEIRRPDGHVLSVTPVARVSHEAGAATVAVRRSDVHRLLLRAAGIESVRLRCRCARLVQHDEKIEAEMENGERVTGDVVIGADGLWSRVRALTFGQEKPREAGYCLWRGIVRLDHASLRSGRAFETWGTGKRFGMVQINGDEVYWYAGLASWPDEPFEEARKRILAEFGEWHAPIRDAVEATDAGQAMRTVVYDRPALGRWQCGRVALMGDAAHPMTPDLGQGACTAIEDAVELSDCLSGHGRVEAALERYSLLRRSRCARIAAQSRRVSLVAQWGSPTMCFARNMVTRLTPAALVCRALLGIVDPSRG